MTQEFTTLSTVIEAQVKLTPMMQQYVEIKKDHEESLLFFRMGDFYELFFEDAVKASKLLNIALTHRGKLGDFPIPMAGIPHHAASNYIDRLTHTGNKVVVCEQMEDPKQAKGIVKRGISQIVSPGIPYDIDKSNHLDHYYIAACVYSGESFYLCYLDFTTGDFIGIPELSSNDLLESLKLNRPKEFIAYFDQWENFPLIKETLEKTDTLTTFISSENFNEKYTSHLISKLIPHYKKDTTLNQFPPILSPVAALCFYIQSTQSIENTGHIKPFRLKANKNHVKISHSTLSGLEILPRSRDLYRDSLLGFLDKTKSAMGARKLKEVFLAPLVDQVELEKRYDFIENSIKDLDKIKKHHLLISEIRDIERILVKLNSNKEIAGDFINLKKSFESLLYFQPLYAQNSLFPTFTSSELKKLKEFEDKISITISEEPGAHFDKGNLIKEGFDKKRDKLKRLAFNFQDELKKLEEEYRKELDVSNLRVKSNNVAGYFVEVSKSHASKMTDKFVRKQTLVNSERYQTKELKDLELEIISSREKLSAVEREIQKDLTQTIIKENKLIQKSADFLALLDVFLSMSLVSFNKDFSRPQIKSEKGLSKYFGLITGPNMAGKTTVMREVAICQFLAQIGCFVPAKSAELSLCDFIFSRLGASDDILKGQSTFMVEMSETAEILRHATDRSLIILDEIGRGTSTYDGLSIAWALMEYLVEETKALTLFSTHYHELIDLADELKASKNLTVKTTKYKGQVRFLYELIEQGATQSFGIHVAELAGLPRKILNRSSQILKRLETDQKETPSMDLLSEDFTQQVESIENKNELEEQIKALDINQMTPLQALQALSDLKSKVD